MITLHYLYISIINSYFLKYSFFYSCSIQLANLMTPETTGISNFIDTILSSVPTKIAGYLGIIYGIAIVVKKGSETYKAIMLHRYEVKMAKQIHEQGEMDSAKKKKDFEL